MRIAALRLDCNRSLNDGASLHLGNLRERDAETAATKAKHRILLVQLFNASQQRAQLLELGRLGLGGLDAGDLDQQVFSLGQELVQRRIEQANGDRQRLHRLEETDEIGALHGQQFLECGAAIFLVVGQNHGAHVLNAVFGKEHVLGAAKADALGAEQARVFGVARDVGVGANTKAANRIDPAHELDQIGIVGLSLKCFEAALDDAAGGSVE